MNKSRRVAKKRPPRPRKRQIGLDLDLAAVELGAGRVGEAGAQLAAAGEEGRRLDRIVDPLVEAGDADPLVAGEIIFPARLGVPQPAVGQERVAGELAVGFEILVDLRGELAELRAGDRLRGVQAKLHVAGEAPGDGQGRQPIAIGEIGRRQRAADRLDVLRPVLVAHAQRGAHAVGRARPRPGRSRHGRSRSAS